MFAVQGACRPQSLVVLCTEAPTSLLFQRCSMLLGIPKLPFGRWGGVERSGSLGTDVPPGAYKLEANNNAPISSFLRRCFSWKLFSCLWLLACIMWPFNKDFSYHSRVLHQSTQPHGTGVMTVCDPVWPLTAGAEALGSVWCCLLWPLFHGGQYSCGNCLTISHTPTWVTDRCFQSSVLLCTSSVNVA